MQLKSDVIEGKLPCTPEQAVLLAAYSVQGSYSVQTGRRLHDFGEAHFENKTDCGLEVYELYS